MPLQIGHSFGFNSIVKVFGLFLVNIAVGKVGDYLGGSE